jgi:hypothetical protein
MLNLFRVIVIDLSLCFTNKRNERFDRFGRVRPLKNFKHQWCQQKTECYGKRDTNNPGN